MYTYYFRDVVVALFLLFVIAEIDNSMRLHVQQ